MDKSIDKQTDGLKNILIDGYINRQIDKIIDTRQNRYIETTEYGDFL